MAKKWIQGMNMKEGALTAQAKAAGMSLDAFCAQKDLSGTTKRRCSLRHTLMGFSKKKK